MTPAPGSRLAVLLRFVLPLLLGLALLAGAIWQFAPHLPEGVLVEYDEYHTLDRSLSVLSKGDPWTVYSLNEPSFRKPPLQYWISALVLRSGVDTELALRSISFLAALGTLVLTGFLGLRLVPKTPAVAVSAMLILAGSPLFWDIGTSALLDSGATLIVVATALCLLTALERPKYLWAVAVLVGLGALQKSPAAAVTVAAMLLTLRFTDRESLRLLWSAENRPTRRGALRLGIVLILIWPALQTARYGVRAISESLVQEMLGRFAPGAPKEVVENGANWAAWLVKDAPWLWGPALAAALALPFLVRRPAAWAVTGWVVLFFLGMTFAGGNTYDRYLMLVLPFLAAALAATLTVLLRLPLLATAAAVGLFAVAGGMLQVPERQVANGVTPYLGLMKNFRAALRPEDSLVACNWTKEGRRIYPGAMSVYASGGKPIVALKHDPYTSRDQDLAGAPPPYRGLCSETDFATVQTLFSGVTAVERGQDMVHWTATGVAP